jgi:translation initiation factor 3 subunit B
VCADSAESRHYGGAQLVFHHHPPSLIDDLEARARKLGKDLSTIDLDAITLPVGVDFDIAR